MKQLLKDFLTKRSVFHLLLPFTLLVTHIQTKPMWGYAWYEPTTLWSLFLVALILWLSAAILKHVRQMDNAWLKDFLMLDDLGKDK